MESHDEERREIGAGHGSGVEVLDDVSDRVGTIETRHDVAAFVLALRQDLLDGDDDWENPTLERYLEAVAARVNDLDGYFDNRGEPVPQTPSWRLLGEMLLAAKMYE